MMCFLCGEDETGTHISGEHGMICQLCVEQCYEMLHALPVPKKPITVSYGDPLLAKMGFVPPEDKEELSVFDGLVREVQQLRANRMLSAGLGENKVTV